MLTALIRHQRAVAKPGVRLTFLDIFEANAELAQSFLDDRADAEV